MCVVGVSVALLYSHWTTCSSLELFSCELCHGVVYSSNDSSPNGFFPSLLWSAVEMEDMKKVSNSLTVLLNEKQKQEKVRSVVLVSF